LTALVVVAALLELGAPRPSTAREAPSQRVRKVRAALLVGWAAVHLALVLEPLLGGTNAFAWRMFTEDLKLQVSLSVRGRDAAWRASPLPGAPPWSSNGYLHHWSSWSEQRPLVDRYADWLLERYPGLTGVELTVLAQTNEHPWRTYVATRTRAAPLAEGAASEHEVSR
jgi:hypothetical protein